jgi:hypothetical protein
MKELVSMQLPAKAYDSAGWLNLALAKKSGAVAAGLYPGWNLTRLVAKTAAEIDFGLWSYNEGASSNPNLGANQGIIDASEWCNRAYLIGQPNAAPVYMPNDQVGDTPAIIEYFHAGAETIIARGRVPGFYGQTVVWEQIRQYGFKYFVHAPDGDEPPYIGANIVQSRWPASTAAAEISIGGVGCDVDTIQTIDFGGWNADGLWPKPQPKPKGIDMFIFANPAPGATDTYLYPGCEYIPTPADQENLRSKGVVVIPVSAAFFAELTAKKV